MKRRGYLYDKIASVQNIIEADYKARRGKHNIGVILHKPVELEEDILLNEVLLLHGYSTSDYTKFTIYEPKQREIFRLPYYPDRILHHSIMNVMEDIWVNSMIRDTYACIKGRGIHALAKRLKGALRKNPEGTKYCLKLDIKKFYPSINHDILKNILSRKIKDKSLLALLYEIIDSADGVPIGNYLSQFFANLYLTYFDHWIKEQLKIKYYYRYCDDIVILNDNKEQLHKWRHELNKYLTNNLKLQLKPNYQVFPVESRGINFVGYVFYHTHTKLRKSIKIRLHKLVYSYIFDNLNKNIFLKSFMSYFGWLKYCDSKHLLHLIEEKTYLKFSSFTGRKIGIKNIYNKCIYIVEIISYVNYWQLHYIYRNKRCITNTSSRNLVDTIRKAKSNHIKIMQNENRKSKTCNP